MLRTYIVDGTPQPHERDSNSKVSSTVTTKAVAGAKSLGNFLYSAVNKAGAKVSEASAKIKKTVEENVSTHIAIILQKTNNPWITVHDVNALKRHGVIDILNFEGFRKQAA